ncbi:hypothetical protein PS2015_2305 [Pseudohongiella spirulinae]|uniref:Uncharacterized protein n=2 Tax=Pseudohongiella spirulinae TaxID=1249552 RepID=A0A0S2KF20_9GAMM|nr:hypothetical protein PS2015_2305 [Pseudohongiella spirulinae]
MSEHVSRKTIKTLSGITMTLLVVMLTALVLTTLWTNNRHLLLVVANNAVQPYGLIVDRMDNLTFRQSSFAIDNITLRHPASGLSLQLQNLILEPGFNGSGRLTARLDPFYVRWSGNLTDGALDQELRIDDLRAEIPSSSLECDRQYQCQVSIAGQGYVTIGKLSYDGIGLSQASAYWQAPLSLAYDSERGWLLEDLQTESQFRISNFQSHSLSANLSDFQFQQTVTLGRQLLDADLRMSLDSKQILSAQFTQNLQSGNGNGKFALDALKFDSKLTLSRLLPSLPQDIDVVDGQLLANGSLTWRWTDSQLSEVHGPITLMAQSLSGYVDDSVFTRLGWHAPLFLKSDGTVESRDTVSVALAGLDIGVTLTDINTRARFDTASRTLELDRPSISIFGGTVSAPGLSWQAEQTSDIELQLRDIDIADVLSLTAYEAVSATGILNGELPVRLSGTQATITEGRIRAAPPGGTISYRHPSQTSGNDNTDLVFRALQRYNYDTLDMQVDLLTNGDLILNTALQGSSPMLNDGQRINLNLNITDNIPALLNSLQAGRSVTETLMRRLND